MNALFLTAANGTNEAVSTYQELRHFADSWGLLALTLFFIGVVIFVFRPGARKHHQDSADIPFRHEDRPASDADRAGL